MDDIISFIKHPGPWHEVNKTELNGPGNYSEIRTIVSEVSTNYGRCYSFYLDWPMSGNDFYSFGFNMSKHDELILFIHQRQNEVGLNWGYWPVSPFSIVVKKKDEIMLTVQRNFFKTLKSLVHCEEDEDYSYPSCVMAWAKAEYGRMFKRYNKTGKCKL